MSSTARAFVSLIITAGSLCLLFSVTQWNCADYARFGTFLLVGIFASQVKVGIPGVSGTLTAALILVLLAILELSPGETVAIALASTTIQVYWRAQVKPRLIQLLFNLSNLTIAVVGCTVFYFFVEATYPALGKPVILAAAAAVYFLLNTFPIAIIIALTEGGAPLGIWKQAYLWSFPYYLVGASLAGIFHYVALKHSWQIAFLVLPLIYLFYRSYKVYTQHIEDSRNHAQQLAALHLRSIEALALAIEAKDDTTHDHLQRVQTYALGIGSEMGLTKPELDALQAASILHDIGKLAVPEAIICKPGKLTPEEFQQMKIHPIVGAEIVERMDFPYAVAPLVRAHHEKWNGEGYPDGLKGEEIPLGARILAAVDCLDALASDRQYRRALPLDEAMKVVVRESNKAFDPRVVEVLLRRHRELEAIAREKAANSAKLSTGIKVNRGAAPDAGFESSHGNQPADADPTRRRMAFLEAISTAMTDVRRALDLAHWTTNEFRTGEILYLVSARLKPLLHHDAMAVLRVENRHLRAIFAIGEDEDLLTKLDVPLGAGVVGWVAENRKPMLNANPAVEPCAGSWPRRTCLRSALVMPVMDDGAVVGVVAAYQKDTDAFHRDHLPVLEAVAVQLAPFLVGHEIERAPEAPAVDPITNLPGTRAFCTAADTAIHDAGAAGVSLTLMLFHMNWLYRINDQFGRSAGDRILCEFARHLRSAFREDDLIARLGSDEFAVLAHRSTSEALASRLDHITDNLASICGSLFEKSGTKTTVGAAQMPQDGSSLEELLAVAERRLQEARPKLGAPLLETHGELSLQNLYIATSTPLDSGDTPGNPPSQAYRGLHQSSAV